MGQSVAGKQCSKCKEIKDINEFSKDKSRKDGVYPVCKSCRRLYRAGLVYEPATTGTKICGSCGENKRVSEFYRHSGHKDGLCSRCKVCEKLYKSKLSYAPVTEGTKICRKCGKEKQVNEFYKDKGSKDGLQSRCKACCAAHKLIYRAEHKEDTMIYNAFYYDKNREKMIKRAVSWRRANPGKVRAKDNLRRARKLGNGGRHTAEDVQRQGAQQNWICYWQGPGCKRDCKDEYEVDHIIPLSRGGTNGAENIVVSCPHCNRSKYNKLPEEYLKFINKIGDKGGYKR